MKIWIGVVIIALLTVSIVFVGCRSTRVGYGSAPYEVVRKEGEFELRDYPALMVVETVMTSSDDGFNRLFRFISGENEAEEKIAMTTPVFMGGDEAERTMAFVLPSELDRAHVPRPKDESLRLRELPAGRFAVMRFSGGRKAALEADKLARLEAWMKDEGLAVVSAPIYGYFDPPWIPGFLRRNEVMLQTRAAD